MILHQKKFFPDKVSREQLCRRRLGVPVGTEWNRHRQFAFVKKKVDGVLSCIRSSAAGRWRAGILPLPSALMMSLLECRVLLRTPKYKRDVAILQQVQQRAGEMFRGLFLREKTENCDFSLEKRSLRGGGRNLKVCTNI